MLLNLLPKLFFIFVFSYFDTQIGLLDWYYFSTFYLLGVNCLKFSLLFLTSRFYSFDVKSLNSILFFSFTDC